MNVRLTHLDGSMPNLALMKLAHWHRAQGHNVHFFRDVTPTLFDLPSYDRVYGSAIFHFSAHKVQQFIEQWPGAIVGGTWNHQPGQPYAGPRVDRFTGPGYEACDYSMYPTFDASIGFTQRGCRLNCGFCGVPTMEGKNHSVSSIHKIWRGDPWPKKLHLLDNDFFGQPDWRKCIDDIRDGGFRVCWSQGLNIRLIDDEGAAALATIEYRDTQFKERKLYTAWDMIGNEKIFFEGIERLNRAGIPPTRIYAYMLCGYKQWSWHDVWYRFKRMTDIGIEPFAMVYDKTIEDLVCFARWCNQGMYRIDGCSWPEYKRATKSEASVLAWRQVYGS